MATENAICERCGARVEAVYPARIETTKVRTTIHACTSCQDSMADFICFPPRYTLVTLNPMTNQWVPRAEPMTLPDIRRTLNYIGNAAYRVYDFSFNLDQQKDWWKGNPWALRNVQGRMGEL